MAPRNKNSQKNKDIQKQQKRKKRARIIIRNLPFRITKESLQEYFAQYGNIEEVNILTKPDGKPVGCGFIQFDHVQSAAKAIHYANLKPLLGRSIVVDWAVPKNKFSKNTVENKKDESGDDIKTEEELNKDGNDESTMESEGGINSPNDSNESVEISTEENEEEMEELSEQETEDVKDMEVKEELLDEEELDEEDRNMTKNSRYMSNDVQEGKTVFLKNVPFSVKNEELKQYMEQFGPVYYALICVDPLTEHSKGTAFVKFKNVEDAEKCLSAGTELRLRDEILEVHKALNRNDVMDKKNFKHQKEKDSRNLYLVKEGVVMAGSPAAVGVSATDMAKRLQLERWKSQILRNLNMFVSRVRLVVQNLPPSLDDAKLREIFKKYSNPKAIIREARIMRDLKNVDAKGIGKSKEYGFVTFTKHEDALKALRAINNNPNIFSPHKRPIVAFSIENRIMVNAKQKRIQKSQIRNPLWPGNKDQVQNKNINKSSSVEQEKVETINETDGDTKSFSGVKSKPGQTKIRSKFNLKNQAIVHNQMLKKEKKAAKNKHSRKTKLEKVKKEVKPKQGTKKMNSEDSNFNKLVNSYKTKLLALDPTRSKWYDTSVYTSSTLRSITFVRLSRNNENAKRTIMSKTLGSLTTEIEKQECTSHRPYEEIPGPKPIPILGNTWRFIPYIGDFKISAVDKISKKLYEQYGDIVKMEKLLGRPDMVFVYDANEIERIFRQEESMPYRPAMPSLNYYKRVLRKEFFKEDAGVIAIHGESWYNFRSKVQQVMLQPRTARMYVGAIEESSRAFLQRIKIIRDSNDEVPDNFMNELHKWSLESIARVALDVRLGCFEDKADADTQELINAVLTFFKNIGILELKIPFWRVFNTPTWKKFANALDTIVRITSKYTNAALLNGKNKSNSDKELSLLERVLAIEGNAKLATILALDLFLVGIDTTSNSVASALYQLALHPDKQELAYEEICNTLPHRDEPIEAVHLDNLKYLKACIKETMRMYPVVIGNGRCMTKDTVISGYNVPKGVQVVFQHYVISNLDKYFPRSKEFLPERWLQEDGVCHAFASLPFGYGRRMCLGRRFAELEMIIVISKILQYYKIEYHHEKLDYYIDPMYTPKGPLKLRFVNR
ncbi:hypothetical protein KPH14_002331 [Odynerus spinipes]|uniref:RRM domain-containing protein n=1 Tax=Odynerus spinipes TaxID=1348599 RepID=A0AAD9VP65_9HYME|nr:hypothetical protein KPH14_002331 [Odynerus spinipes]